MWKISPSDFSLHYRVFSGIALYHMTDVIMWQYVKPAVSHSWHTLEGRCWSIQKLDAYPYIDTTSKDFPNCSWYLLQIPLLKIISSFLTWNCYKSSSCYFVMNTLFHNFSDTRFSSVLFSETIAPPPYALSS